MAEAFLALLPKVKRGVISKEDRHCSICMEEYGTTPSANGTIEHAVRLPCNHVVGSECISIWLTPTPGQHSHNTCPVCRHEFFPVSNPPQRRPRMRLWWTEHMRIHAILHHHVTMLGHQLALNADVNEMGTYIADRIHDLEPLDGRSRSLVAVAGASVYMASHIFGHGRSLRRIAQGVPLADVGNFDVEAILHAYGSAYQNRRELIDWDLLARVIGRPMGMDQVDEILIPPHSELTHNA